MAVNEVRLWRTSDGTAFEDEMDAERYETQWEFRNWCRENICVGGEWDADMVSNKILAHFRVTPR